MIRLIAHSPNDPRFTAEVTSILAACTDKTVNSTIVNTIANVVLYQDAVYAAVDNKSTNILTKLLNLSSASDKLNVKIFALADDLLARSLTIDNNEINLITYHDLVELISND